MGITEEHIERLKKWAETLKSCGKAAVGISSELDALLQDNQQMEQQIELLDEANDRLRERLNRSENHDGYMKLPLDADGVPIRIGDVLYSSGNECRVVSITVKADEACVGVHTDEGVFLPSVNPKYLSRKNPAPLEDEPADSWEKLEADLLRGSTADAYFQCGDISCSECPHSREVTGSYCWMNRNLDILARAKKLAGIEEEAER